MSQARGRILDALRRAVGPLPNPAAYPEYDAAAIVREGSRGIDGKALFVRRLAEANGRFFAGGRELAGFLRAEGLVRGYCDPGLWEKLAPALAGLEVETAFSRGRLDEYAFGITPAAGAIAESGTLLLNEASSPTRLGALAPWAHIAVVDPQNLFPDIPSALTALGADPNVVWVTGPSKTADVEGILIEGVHGPGVQGAMWLPSDSGRQEGNG